MATAPAHLLLILDTETTGIDEGKDEVLEVAAILYSLEHHCTLQQISTLLPTDREQNPAEAINQIPIAAANATPPELAEYLCQTINYWGQIAEYIVAHNAEFDRKWFKNHPIFHRLYDRPWLCSCHDITWPKQHKSGQKLIELALAHGVGVSSAHRALTDCQLLAALFDRMENLPELISQATRPKLWVKAEVSYGDRQLAKDAGFRWDGSSKQWIGKLSESELAALPFPYRILDAGEPSPEPSPKPSPKPSPAQTQPQKTQTLVQTQTISVQPSEKRTPLPVDHQRDRRFSPAQPVATAPAAHPAEDDVVPF